MPTLTRLRTLGLYFELLRRLGPVPLSLVFVLFPVVAQVAAVLGGERGTRHRVRSSARPCFTSARRCGWH